jgi:hypothetical protein
LFAAGLSLQEPFNCIQKFCNEWKLKIIVEKTMITELKKVRKLNKNEKMGTGSIGNTGNK